MGTIAVQMSPPDMLEKIIPFLIAAIGIYTLFAPSLGMWRLSLELRRPRGSVWWHP
nr:hypothetical protein [Psychrobacter sp. PraFG1]UNK05711.1 hypothetical protein MN210_02420 [Psychrobacter sp. PraFG1]